MAHKNIQHETLWTVEKKWKNKTKSENAQIDSNVYFIYQFIVYAFLGEDDDNNGRNDDGGVEDEDKVSIKIGTRKQNKIQKIPF